LFKLGVNEWVLVRICLSVAQPWNDIDLNRLERNRTCSLARPISVSVLKTQVRRYLKRANGGAKEKMAKAIWNGKVIAESETTEVVEGNVYFPESSLKREYFRSSSTTSTCPWKGQAKYMSLYIDGQDNPDAAWYYPDPKPAARKIKGFVAFWRGVEVEK
jgi:uncharacterized protein (DUF427 family)